MTGSAQSFPRLLGDVGGTNARFAWQAAPGAAPSQVLGMSCADHPSLLASVQQYLRQQGLAAPRAAAIGVATAVVADEVAMTNHPWHFSRTALQTALGVDRLLVLNDFEALAHAVPGLAPTEIRAIGSAAAPTPSPVAVPGATKALLGPGTGLGVSGLVADGRGGWLPLVGEGGHVTLAACNKREASLLAVMRERFGHVSAERALSGPGLQNLYRAVCVLDGDASGALEPADVIAKALARGDAQDLQCLEALTTFVAMLGGVAGNLALTLGARGGVYLGGGILPRLGAQLDRLPFRARFEDKGRFKAYLQNIPTWLIVADNPALTGAARALDQAQAARPSTA